MRFLIVCLVLLFAACSEEQKQTAEELREGAQSVQDEGAQADEASYEVPSAYEGEYRLQSLFRGEGECLDGNYDDPDTNHGGVYMAPCDGSADQTWRFTPVEDAHHYQISSMHDGERLCLDGNERDSAIHDGAAFLEPCRRVAGQIWTLTEEANGTFRLHTSYLEHGYCLESNSADYPQHSGASYMDTCQNVTGQLWRLVRLDAPPPSAAQAAMQDIPLPLHSISECEHDLTLLARYYYEYPEDPNAARPDDGESFAAHYETFQKDAREHCPRVGQWIEQTVAARGEEDQYQRMLAEHSQNALYPNETLTGWQDYFDGTIGILRGSERLIQHCPQDHQISFDCETVTERTRLRIEQALELLSLAFAPRPS